MKKTGNKRLLTLLSTGLLIVAFSFPVACTNSGGDGEPKTEEPTEPKEPFTNVLIPAEINVFVGSDITFTGEGFRMGDQIKLVLSTDANTVYTIGVKAVTGQSVTFSLSEEVNTGNYSIWAVREGETFELGATVLNISLDISGVVVPSEVSLPACGDITFAGKGFQMGDQIKLTLLTNENTSCTVDVKEVTGQSVTFALHEDAGSGSYRLWLVRGTRTLSLGTTTLDVSFTLTIPDKPGMTVKGVVHSNGRGIPGVIVSDGYLVTETGSNGIYYLASEKRHGYVFVSIPGNYEPLVIDNIPQFFKKLTADVNTKEQADFGLTAVNNEKHVILALADLHMANRTADLSQFNTYCLPDVNGVINDYKSRGIKPYILTLGDMTWDTYWYSNPIFYLPDYVNLAKNFGTVVFNTMGNHDNDPDNRENDFQAEQLYRNFICPTYYSFNLGKIHYVVLDDIFYNASYSASITTNQIEWLKKDLAKVADKTAPLVIAMHIQLYTQPNLENSASFHLTNGSTLVSCLAGFTNVHVLTGHTHYNYNYPSIANPWLMEHNTAAVCATWWWTGNTNYAGNHISKDGAVGGYGVYELDGKNLEWYYKSIGYNRDYQFRSYDLNEILITTDKYAPLLTDAALKASAPTAYAAPYNVVNDRNEVLINVWNYDPRWKVEVTEGTTPLTVTRVSTKDPLHIISYEYMRMNRATATTPTADFVTNNTTHMFRVTAGTPTSTLNIKVTDRFGNVYTETMTRPKPFAYNMK